MKIPEIDLTFALSATSTSAENTYPLMKEAVKMIINRYGVNKIHYSVIVYGNVVTTRVSFADKIPRPEDLKTLIEALPEVNGGSSLGKALKEANRVFDGSGVRPNAVKVLVVITDKSSGMTESNIRTAVTPLEDKGVKIIPVAIGDEADPTELVPATSDNIGVITVPKSVTTEGLAEEIMETIIKGKAAGIGELS